MTETEQKPARTKTDAASQSAAATPAVTTSDATIGAEEAETVDDGRKAFRITERAGPRVAGQLHDGKTIRLTDHEALAEVIDGTIEPVDAKTS